MELERAPPFVYIQNTLPLSEQQGLLMELELAPPFVYIQNTLLCLNNRGCLWSSNAPHHLFIFKTPCSV